MVKDIIKKANTHLVGALYSRKEEESILKNITEKVENIIEKVENIIKREENIIEETEDIENVEMFGH